jgi:Swt1-like HEPN
MSSEAFTTYEFAFRALLTEEALDRSGRAPRSRAGLFDDTIADKLSLDLLDEQFTTPAKEMAAVYIAIAAFETSVRDLVVRVLLEAVGADWWERCVSERVRTHCQGRQEDEERNRFHKQRGDAPINYTELKHLVHIMRANWDHFEPFLPSPEWATSIFETIERSRNVIMHSGILDPVDVERVGINVRDWVKQVGS